MGHELATYVSADPATSRQTAAVAIRILLGEKPSDINTSVVQFASPIFDWRQVQRWGISESRLPPGSKIYFRDPTVWEQYRWQIMLITSVILIQAALIVGLLYEHRRRQIAEAHSLQRVNELARMNRFATAGELSPSPTKSASRWLQFQPREWQALHCWKDGTPTSTRFVRRWKPSSKVKSFECAMDSRQGREVAIDIEDWSPRIGKTTFAYPW
jgi:hypothetical protein